MPPRPAPTWCWPVPPVLPPPRSRWRPASGSTTAACAIPPSPPLAATRSWLAQDPARCEAEIRARLQGAGTPEPGIAAIIAAAEGREGGLAGLAVALRAPAEPATAQGPGAHALWMFAADLFAGAVPVLPFALLPIEEARWLSIAITAILLVALGIGRGMVAERGIARSVVETVGVAAAAALGGLIIGQVATRLV